MYMLHFAGSVMNMDSVNESCTLEHPLKSYPPGWPPGDLTHCRKIYRDSTDCVTGMITGPPTWSYAGRFGRANDRDYLPYFFTPRTWAIVSAH
jgi:hypothetical protein